MRLLPASLLALISTALTHAHDTSSAPACGTQSQPNPIATQYFANITGTLNGTLAILPVPLSLVRHIIPPGYSILTDQYQRLLPHLPADTYPVLIQAVVDHDIRFMDYRLADFSRVSLEFPFIRYFSDSDTPFRYVPSMLMSATNEIAINGSREYGSTVYPAAFEPGCDAYASAALGDTHLNALSSAGDASVKSLWRSVTDHAASPLSLLPFVKHAVNQPVFGTQGKCNHQTRLFSTAISRGVNAPRKVSGTVAITIPGIFDAGMRWDEVDAVQVDTAFIERHLIDCEEMRGWRYEDDSVAEEEEVADADWEDDAMVDGEEERKIEL